MSRPADPLRSPVDELLVVEPIIGWRSFSLDAKAVARATEGVGMRIYDSVPMIASPSMGTPWYDGTHHWDGRCRCAMAPRFAAITIVGSEQVCVCGVNAYRDVNELLTSVYAAQPMIGKVELSGKVREFELGWRAEKARIVEAWAVVKDGRKRAGISSRTEHEVRRLSAKAGVPFMGCVQLPGLIRREAVWTPLQVQQ